MSRPKQHPAFELQRFLRCSSQHSQPEGHHNATPSSSQKPQAPADQDSNDTQSSQHAPDRADKKHAKHPAGKPTTENKQREQREKQRLAHNRECLDAQAGEPLMSKLAPRDLWFLQPLEEHVIGSKRQRIKQEMLSLLAAQHPECRSSRLSKHKLDDDIEQPITQTLLEAMLAAYDREFFGALLRNKLKRQRTELLLCVGTTAVQETKSKSGNADEIHLTFKRGWAGLCQLKGDRVIVALHSGLNRLQFDPDGEQPEDVNGLPCWDRLDCAQLIFEHELVHMLLMVFRRWRGSHGKPFQDLALGLFGHTLCTHAIGHGHSDNMHMADGSVLSRAECERDKRRKYAEFQLGDMVAFGAGRFGAIVSKTRESVALIQADGSLVEKIPYSDARRTGTPAEHEAGRLRHWCARFLDGKKQIKVGDSIHYERDNGDGVTSVVVVAGRVMSKKALAAQVQTAPGLSLFVPYQCMSLAAAKAPI